MQDSRSTASSTSDQGTPPKSGRRPVERYIHGDNKGAIDLALNPVTGRRSKHITIKHHVIREYVENHTISLICMPTLDMVADGFTKLLSCILLEKHNNDMGLVGYYMSDHGEMLISTWAHLVALMDLRTMDLRIDHGLVD